MHAGRKREQVVIAMVQSAQYAKWLSLKQKRNKESLPWLREKPGTLDAGPVMSQHLCQPVSCRLLPRHERPPILRGGNASCMVRAPLQSALSTDATPSRTMGFHNKMCHTASRHCLSLSPDDCARTTVASRASAQRSKSNHNERIKWNQNMRASCRGSVRQISNAISTTL